MKRIVLVLCLLLSCPVNEHEVNQAHDKMPEFQLDEAAVHPSRCAYEDCVCSVKIPAYVPEFKNVKVDSSLSVFFSENSSSLDLGEKKKIESYIDKNSKASSIFIMGYTDGCGSYNYNKRLAAARSRSTRAATRAAGFSGRVVVSSMSELTSTHSDYAKRADLVTSDNFKLKVLPPNLTADHYLLDASGSMQNYRTWVNIIAANKKKNSKLHLSYTKKCSDGIDALRISPAGPTEVWYSYWQVLDKMTAGQTLIIISDFDSRYLLSCIKLKCFYLCCLLAVQKLVFKITAYHQKVLA